MSTPPLHVAFYLGEKKRNPKATLLDRLICLFTRSPYSHVELVHRYDDNTRVGYCWSSSAPDKGVRHKVITLNRARWEVYRLEDSDRLPDVNLWFAYYEGKSYDWIGALGVRFRFLKHHSDKWFCSEIIAKYLKVVKKPHRCSPAKLFKVLSPRMRLVP